jgi:heme/copper-type cytochrome/quinol oxidase subunit 1
MKEVAIPEALGAESFELEAHEGWLSWVASVDHKKIGLMYLFSSLIFFLIAGVLALVMRIQLAVPENHLLSPAMYNQIFTCMARR